MGDLRSPVSGVGPPDRRGGWRRSLCPEGGGGLGIAAALSGTARQDGRVTGSSTLEGRTSCKSVRPTMGSLSRWGTCEFL